MVLASIQMVCPAIALCMTSPETRSARSRDREMARSRDSHADDADPPQTAQHADVTEDPQGPEPASGRQQHVKRNGHWQEDAIGRPGVAVPYRSAQQR